MRLSLTLVSTVLAVACVEPKNSEIPGCPVSDVWVGPPNYDFIPDNYTCSGTPVDPTVNMDAASFNTVGGLASADAQADLTTTVDVWNDVGSRAVLTLDSLSLTASETAADLETQVFMQAGANPTNPDALATAFMWATEEPGVASDCDIVVWEEFGDGRGVIDWVADGDAAVGEFDLSSVLIHEMGHCLGIGHVEIGFLGTSVMRPSIGDGEDSNTLGPDDEDVLLQMYGA